jgi:hypothetical protein
MAPFSFVPNRAWGMGSVALGAIPHEMRLRKRQCSARYTKADALEEAVFKDLRSTLEHPEIVLAEVRRMKSRGSNPHIDTELRRIDAQARQLRIWEQRMVRLYGFGEIDDDYILRETRKAKGKMQELDRERERLLMQKQEIDNLDAAENAAMKKSASC